MCLIIHKPRGIKVPRELLQSAAEYNPHGFGFMAFAEPGSVRVTKHCVTSFPDLWRSYREYETEECVIHLRKRTRGSIEHDNTHPLLITEQLYLAHNGTLPIPCWIPGKSDTWHLVTNHLRPMLSSRPEAVHEWAFQTFLKAWIGPANKLVFMDARARSTVIIHKEQGVEFDGLWLSNRHWFEATRLGLKSPNEQKLPIRSYKYMPFYSYSV
jgi:glutamine amidotransferase class II-like protein